MFGELLYSLDWTQIVIAALTGFGSLLALWARRRLPAWRKFWRDVAEGLRAIPELRSDVKGIRYYVAPNGGGSLMDSMKRTEHAVGTITSQMDLMVQTMWAENDSDDNVGRFHSNAMGQNTYVNQTYARWLGVGKAELMGWSFINFVHPEDVEAVRRKWEECRTENRQYRNHHRMVATDGAVLDVEVVATPIPEALPAQRWVGSIRRAGNEHR